VRVRLLPILGHRLYSNNSREGPEFSFEDFGFAVYTSPERIINLTPVLSGQFVPAGGDQSHGFSILSVSNPERVIILPCKTDNKKKTGSWYQTITAS
jgi:hypothetical protein